MERICVVDTSLPPYAAPLAHECVATIMVAPDVAGVPELLQALALTLKAQLAVLAVLAIVIAWVVRRG